MVYIPLKYFLNFVNIFFFYNKQKPTPQLKVLSISKSLTPLFLIHLKMGLIFNFI